MPLETLPGDHSHLPALIGQDQERRLRMLTRKSLYSHGTLFSSDEAAELPPVEPFDYANADERDQGQGTR